MFPEGFAMKLPILCTLLSLGALAAAHEPCVMASYGEGCGPVLTGSVEPNGGTQRVTFTVSNAEPKALVLFLLGFQELNVPIPGTLGCSLLTDVVFSQFHQTDGSGVYSWSRALPSDPTGPTLRVQYLEVTLDAYSQLALRTTNGLTLACP